jgi:hypothetical protein
MGAIVMTAGANAAAREVGAPERARRADPGCFGDAAP